MSSQPRRVVMLVVSKLKVFVRNLNRFHKNQLLLSNTLSTMGLIGIGDVFAQYIEIKLTVKKKLADAAAKDKNFKIDLVQQHSFTRNYDSIRTSMP